MHINDRIIGLLAILGGIGVIAGTLGFREIPGQQFGSAFFPRLIGGAMILCGIAFVATAWSARPERLIRIGEMLRGVSGLKVAAVLVAVVVWIALSPYLGFVVTTALLIAALAVLAGGQPLPSVATGLGMAVILFLIFGQLLRVPLPSGLIERLLS